MGFIDKKKSEITTPKPTRVTQTSEQKVVQKTVKKPSIKQVEHTQAYGYGSEENDINISGTYDDHGFPDNNTDHYGPYHTPATPLKPGEKPEHWYKTYTPKPLYEKRSAIILVVECSYDTVAYKNEISKLINKIVQDNSDEFFMFIRFGNATNYSELIKGDTLKDRDVIVPLLKIDEHAENTFDIYAVLKRIDAFVKDYLSIYKIFYANLKQYMLEDARIIFIGSAKTDECKHNPRILLRTIIKNKKVKAVKYFCLKDIHTIKAAALGFPVIGHIESNFYK